jgi:hypothetical protein
LVAEEVIFVFSYIADNSLCNISRTHVWLQW